VSIIICSADPKLFAQVCENYRTVFAAVPHEIIGIHDARSLCEGYNRGVAQASGDILVFSHDDVEIVTPDFAARLQGHLTRHDLVGVAGTTRLIGGSWTCAGWPHLHGQVGSRISKPGRLMVTGYGLHGADTVDVQAIDGLFLAARREVLERIRFDEKTFDGWHLYDLDFTYSAHLAGFRTAVCQDVCLVHNSLGDYRADWQGYVQRFEDKHHSRLQSGKWQEQKRCAIEVASPAEWALMTEEMISGSEEARG
jgi:GT2 family glycosyltransferase